MRALFDARPGYVSRTGIGRYARSVAELLRHGLPGHNVTTLGGAASPPFSARSALEEEFELPSLLEREQIEVFHSSLFRLPAVLPSMAVVTIHDAIPAVRPDLTNPDFARLFEGAFDSGLRADAVVCPSQSAKADVTRYLGVPEERIHVIPEHPAECFRVLSSEERRDARKRLAIEGDYLLVVGSLDRRKNPGLVLDALAELPHARVLFAGPAAGYDVIEEAHRRGLAGRVQHLGSVPDEDLVALYNEATALVFPSHYEGFGLPVVEAFACGTPVIAAATSSIPEVAGDAAVLVDPCDGRGLAEAIARLSSSLNAREDLRRRGFMRLSQFSGVVVKKGIGTLYASLERGGA